MPIIEIMSVDRCLLPGLDATKLTEFSGLNFPCQICIAIQSSALYGVLNYYLYIGHNNYTGYNNKEDVQWEPVKHFTSKRKMCSYEVGSLFTKRNIILKRERTPDEFLWAKEDLTNSVNWREINEKEADKFWEIITKNTKINYSWRNKTPQEKKSEFKTSAQKDILLSHIMKNEQFRKDFSNVTAENLIREYWQYDVYKKIERIIVLVKLYNKYILIYYNSSCDYYVQEYINLQDLSKKIDDFAKKFSCILPKNIFGEMQYTYISENDFDNNYSCEFFDYNTKWQEKLQPSELILEIINP